MACFSLWHNQPLTCFNLWHKSPPTCFLILDTIRHWHPLNSDKPPLTWFNLWYKPPLTCFNLWHKQPLICFNLWHKEPLTCFNLWHKQPLTCINLWHEPPLTRVDISITPRIVMCMSNYPPVSRVMARCLFTLGLFLSCEGCVLPNRISCRYITCGQLSRKTMTTFIPSSGVNR
jgi:hypothetical protein